MEVHKTIITKNEKKKILLYQTIKQTTLSKYIEIYKPRIAYFIDKIKSITVKNFKDVVDSMVNDTGANNSYNSLYNQIYNFLYNFHRKYKNNLFFNNILQLENDFKDEFNLISKKSFLMFYSSDDAEEFYDYENYQDIYEELKEFYEVDDNIKEITSFNIFKPIINEMVEIDEDENDDEIQERSLFDIKIDYKVKKKYNDLDVLRHLYEPLNNNN